MDHQTRQYRKAQLEKLKPNDCGFVPTIKLYDGYSNSTNHMNISWEEMEQIKAILTGVKP